jgi:GNAT superfamily N-acetyltransferase
LSDITQQLTFRPACAGDFDDVQAIASRIWDGHDYIPLVWEHWLAAPKGELAVAVLDDQVIALGKLTWLGEGEWWLEGLRVDPAYQRRGISRALTAYLLQRFREFGGGLVRFATASGNVAVHRVAHENGFVRQAAFLSYQSPFLPLPAGDFRVLSPADAARVWDYFNNASADFDANHRAYAVRTTWYALSEARLSAELEAGHVYGWFGARGGDAIDGIAIVGEPDEDREGNSRLRAGYFDALEGHLATAAQAFRAVGGQLGVAQVRLRTLARPERLVAMEQAGYHQAWDQELWVFALDERDQYEEDNNVK